MDQVDMDLVSGVESRLAKLTEERDALASKLATYRNALEQYGGHRSACHFWPSNAGDGPAICNCGLYELLGAPK